MSPRTSSMRSPASVSTWPSRLTRKPRVEIGSACVLVVGNARVGQHLERAFVHRLAVVHVNRVRSRQDRGSGRAAAAWLFIARKQRGAVHTPDDAVQPDLGARTQRPQHVAIRVEDLHLELPLLLVFAFFLLALVRADRERDQRTAVACFAAELVAAREARRARLLASVQDRGRQGKEPHRFGQDVFREAP